MKTRVTTLLLFLVPLLIVIGLGHANAAAIKWKMPTAYPAGSFLWEFIAVNFSEKVKALSNERLIIEPFTSGAICPALKVTEAVKDGVSEAGHTWTGYEMGRDMTSLLFSGIPGGLTEEQYQVWYYEGNGLKLLKQWRKETIGIASTVLGLGPTEIIHSHKPIHTLKDLSGLKMRTAGVWAEILPKLGAAPVILPASDVYAALEKKLVDAIEWADPGTNYPLGYHQVAKYIIVPGVHLPAWPWELVVNAKQWNKLPDDLKYIVEVAAALTTFESLTKFVKNSLDAMHKFQKAGNEIITFDKEILDKVHKLVDEYCQVQASKNAWFKKVYEDQKAFKENWDKANYIRMRPDGYGR